MENPLDPVTVGDRLATRPALNVPSPLRGLKLLPRRRCCLRIRQTRRHCLRNAQRAIASTVRFASSSVAHSCWRLPMSFVCQAVVSGYSVGHERHVADFVALPTGPPIRRLVLFGVFRGSGLAGLVPLNLAARFLVLFEFFDASFNDLGEAYGAAFLLRGLV
jgi:hypothetical protein